MGIFNRIFNFIAPCFGVPPRVPQRGWFGRYSERDFNYPVNQSHRTGGNNYPSHFSNERDSTAPEIPSSSGVYRSYTARTATQASRQSRVEQKKGFDSSPCPSRSYKSTPQRDIRASVSHPPSAVSSPYSHKAYEPTRNESQASRLTSPSVSADIRTVKYSVNSAKSDRYDPSPLPKVREVKPPQTRAVQVSYYLRNFTSKLEATSKDRTFIAETNVIYHKQWTACCAQIIDRFGNELSSTNTVTLSNYSQVEIRDSKIKNGRLHFRMKSSVTGNVLININIDKFTLAQEVFVTCNPCSSALSEMVVEIIETPGRFLRDECVLRVSIVDVFGEPVSSNSTAICELRLSATSTCEDHVTENRMCSEDGNKCFDITVRGERPWSKDIAVLLNGQSLSPATKFEVSVEERERLRTVLEKNERVLLEEDQVSISDFIERSADRRMFIPFLTGDVDGKFVPYDEKDCQLLHPFRFVCKNTKKYDILGADFAHINNIRRVIELKDRVEIEETTDQTSTIIDFSNIHAAVKSYRIPTCKEVVQHLLRGLYYRKKASQAARVRMEWKKKFIALEGKLLLLQNCPSLKLCKFFKDLFGTLMSEYNRKACDELFKFFNFQRDESEVDLHGLFVADERKLESLHLDMLRGSLSDDKIDAFFGMCKMQSFKGCKKQVLKSKLLKGEMSEGDIEDFIECCQSYIRDDSRRDAFKRDLLQRQKRSKHVDDIISQWREESDEAIRKLKKTLDSFDLEEATENNTPWIEIIVGAGHHSRKKNEQNIRPKVEKLLKERGLKFTAVNKGALVVTFETYTGPQPCFGEYYCKSCDRCWKSSKSYVGKYQKCSRCHVDCWPVKQRRKEKVDKYSRDGAHVKRKSKPHQSSLCQKCKELGYPCNEEDYCDSDY